MTIEKRAGLNVFKNTLFQKTRQRRQFFAYICTIFNMYYIGKLGLSKVTASVAPSITLAAKQNDSRVQLMIDSALKRDSLEP
jgi:hypothetical protein